MYQILPWDSDFFGFRVARITLREFSDENAETLLPALRKDGVRLAYWALPSEAFVDLQWLEAKGAKLVDEKITFGRTLDLAVVKTYPDIQAYEGEEAGPELEALAIISGTYSRFKVDPLIPREKFETLFKIWIRNSVRKSIAKEVLVAVSDQKIKGMISVGEKSGQGNIGLVSVNPEFHGQGIGTALVRSALQWFADQGYTRATVVTQAGNEGGCRLYTSCGFKILKKEKFFHLWL